jgi:TPR repeat protein
MERKYFLLFLLVTICSIAYSEVKKVTWQGVVYNVDTENGTASVGQNYVMAISSTGNKSYTGSLYGNIVIAPSVKYRGKYYTVTSIDADAFYGCRSIVSVSIPETVTTLDRHNFNYMLSDLKAINVASGNEFFQSVDGVLFSKDMSRIIRFPSGRTDTEYTIPSSVLKIDDNSFSCCSNLREVVLPDGVKYIGEGAFENCYFEKIILPESVVEVGKGAFTSCFNLVSVTIPQNVTSIGINVFNYCFKLESIICRNKELVFTSDMIYSCEKLNGNIIYDLPADEIKKLAVNGDAEYQYRLALNYLEGKGVQKDIKLAMVWFGKSAEAGNVPAQMALGDIYLGGKLNEKNFPEAIKWYTMAAKNGNVRAQSFLGDCYFDAIEVKQDLKSALSYYTMAASQGDSNAVKKLGYCYYNGKGVDSDFAEAGKWYMKSAQNGDAESAYFVSLMLSEGKGLAKDDAEALKWAEKAVEGGVQESRWLYCKLAYDDAKMSMNTGLYQSAISRFSSLLEYDERNTDAYIDRGYCYMMTRPADYTLAEADFKKALELDKGNTVAQNNLQVVNERRKRYDDAKILINEGDSYFIIKDYVNAVTSYAKSVYVDDTNPYPFCGIGYCYMACELYTDAISFFDKASAIDPGYDLAAKGREAAATLMLNKAISNAANNLSNSLNDAYNNSLNNNSQSYNNSLSNSVDRAVEREQKYSNNQYEMYMRLYEQEKAETDNNYQRYELYGNVDDLRNAKDCQSRAADYLEKANIWK